MNQMRAVSLTGYLEVANVVGLDGRRMLRRAGIAAEALESPENRLPAEPMIRLLEDSAARSGCESFGLLMAEARTFASLGPLSLLLEHLPNLREVVRTCISFQRYLNDIVLIDLEENGDTCLIRLDLAPGYWGVQLSDLLLGIAHRVLSGASGNRWKPACVHAMHEAPGDLAPWRRFFETDLEFESNFNGFSCSTASMLAPLPLANEEMARHARKLLALMSLNREPGTTSDRVRRMMTLLLPSGRATLDQVAAQMGLSPRSLQRQLEQEGHRFAGLLDSVRRELAESYLAGSGRSITAIAGLLGYASPGSFTRWFAGAFEMSPQAWRARLGEGEQAGPPPIWKP